MACWALSSRGLLAESSGGAVQCTSPIATWLMRARRWRSGFSFGFGFCCLALGVLCPPIGPALVMNHSGAPWLYGSKLIQADKLVAKIPQQSE